MKPSSFRILKFMRIHCRRALLLALALLLLVANMMLDPLSNVNVQDIVVGVAQRSRAIADSTSPFMRFVVSDNKIILNNPSFSSSSSSSSLSSSSPSSSSPAPPPVTTTTDGFDEEEEVDEEVIRVIEGKNSSSQEK